MKKLIKIIRISSKQWFKRLRDKWEIYCEAINNTFIVSNLFLKHISGWSKNRKLREIIERLSIINLVEEIALKWNLVETREKVIIEKYFYKRSYKLLLNIKWIDFFLVLAEKNNWKIILISTFLNFRKNKKDCVRV